MELIYAQIDAAGVCFSVAQLSGPVDAPDMIQQPSLDYSVLGKKWDGATWLTWNGSAWI